MKVDPKRLPPEPSSPNEDDLDDPNPNDPGNDFDDDYSGDFGDSD